MRGESPRSSTYDNVLQYNLEGFFRRLFPDSDIPKDTVIVCTADHGESLGEQGGKPPLRIVNARRPSCRSSCSGTRVRRSTPSTARTIRISFRSLSDTPCYARPQPRSLFGVDLGKTHRRSSSTSVRLRASRDGNRVGQVLSTRWVFANAWPAPDFRYFSKRNAIRSLRNSMVTSMLHGFHGAVDWFCPALCALNRAPTSDLTPV